MHEDYAPHRRRGLQRRDVQDLNAGLSVKVEHLVEGPEERGERLAAPGGREEQRVLTTGDGQPAFGLNRRWVLKSCREPVVHRLAKRQAVRQFFTSVAKVNEPLMPPVKDGVSLKLTNQQTRYAGATESTVATRVLGEVPLVVLLGEIERWSRNYLSCNRAIASAARDAR